MTSGWKKTGERKYRRSKNGGGRGGCERNDQRAGGKIRKGVEREDRMIGRERVHIFKWISGYPKV